MLNLWARCSTDSAKFELRFLDTKTDDPDDHPWRMHYTIDNTKVVWDSTWQLIQIPLDSFVEQGSYDDGIWYDPQGKFDWSQIEKLEIAADHHDLKDIVLYFDDIKIIEPSADIRKPYNDYSLPARFALDQNYPNPFNSSTVIRYTLSQHSHVKLEIFNILGEKICKLFDSKQDAGSHIIEWNVVSKNSDKITSGIYFLSFEAVSDKQTFTSMKKMIFIK